MGIKRLYSYLSYAFEKNNIQDCKDLTNVTVGIDAMGWLYQAYFGYCEDSKDVNLAIIRNIEMKVKHLEKNKIKFYFIIDGKSLNCKSNTKAFRDKKREKHLKKSKEMEQKNYDIGESSVYKKYSEKVSQDIIYFFIDFLKVKNYNYIVAPYESDSQLYYLYKQKIIDYIISEDSDIIAFGCNDIIKGFKKNGQCQILNQNTIDRLKKSIYTKKCKDLTKKKKCIKFFELPIEDRIEICIACGCDYLENIKGLGFGTLIDQYDHYDSLRQFLKQYCEDIDHKKLKLYQENIKNRKQYLKIFDYVKCAFQNQLIYDPLSKKMIILSKKRKNEWNQFKEKEQKELINYIGDKTQFQNPQEFSKGNLYYDTMKKRSQSNFDFDRAIRFINSKPKQTIFILSNLCCTNYGYDNFDDFEENDKKNISENTSQTDDKDKSQRSIHNISINNKKLKINQLSFLILRIIFEEFNFDFFHYQVQSFIYFQ